MFTVSVGGVAAWMCLATLLPRRPREEHSNPLLFLGGMPKHSRSLPAGDVGIALGDILST